MGLVLMAVMVIAASMAAHAQEAAPEPVNLSAERGLGIGMQVGLPFGGLLSGRYWLSPEFGVEGIAFLSGNVGFFEGQVTGRGLYRVLDAAAVDLYIAGGATLPFPGDEPVVSVLAGIEFGFRFAPQLAWNIEFGMTYAIYDGITMAIGTGIHVYFDRPDNE
jgi:hypothetical protein